MQSNLSIRSYVDELLTEWASWARDNTSKKLDFPATSPMFMLIRNSEISISYTSENPRAEVVERLLVRLSQFYPPEAQAIRDYYLFPQPKESLAKRLHVSVRTLETRIQRGKIWLEGHLSSNF